MKMICLILFVIIGLTSCSNENSVGVINGISTNFKLLNANGKESTSFKSDENFQMKFSVTNLSGNMLSYHYTGVPVIFGIVQNDSVVATSVDGLTFAQVVLGGSIKNGDTYRINWTAPYSPGRQSKFILSPGKYEAVVIHKRFFDNYQLKSTEPIEFTVIKN